MNKKTKSLCGYMIVPAVLFFTSQPSILIAKDDAKKSCADKVVEESIDWEKETPKFLEATVALIKRNKSVPNRRELAKHMKLPAKKISAFFKENGAYESPKDLAEAARESFPDEFAALRAELFKKVARYLKEELQAPTKKLLAILTETPSSELELIYGSLGEDFYEDFAAAEEKTMELLRKRVIKAYAKAAREHGRVPHLAEIALNLNTDEKSFVDFNSTLSLFKSPEELKEATMAAQPGSFKNFTDTDLHNGDRLEAIKKAFRERTRLILVTAVAGTDVEPTFFKSLLNYAKRNDAEIIVLPSNMQTVGLDPVLVDTPGVHVLTHHFLVNPWFTISRIKVLAKQMNPNMGTKRLGKRGKMVVTGSPKMHVDPTATVNNLTSPHRVVSTGAITKNEYSARHYVGLRTDFIAEKDHVYGALIVEKSYGEEFTDFETAGFFHARHVEYIPEEEGFMDLGKFYTPTAARPVRPEALVLGDIHVGDTDETLIRSIREQLLALKPKYVVLHDLLNGYSISPHEKDNIVKLADKAKHGDLNLKAEVERVVHFVDALMAIDPQIKVVIVPSNHDYWLHRYLMNGQFTKDPENAVFGAELYLNYTRDRMDPFKAILMHKDRGVQYPKRLIFLDIGNPFNVGKHDPDPEKNRLVELALHGHQGANGAKLSVRSMQEAVDRGVFGHTHTYARRNSVVNAGTITHLNLSYNRGGYSNWTQAAAIVGPNGEIQALEHKEGEWFRDLNNDKEDDPERFYFPDYPRERPNPGPANAGGIDQWSSN